MKGPGMSGEEKTTRYRDVIEILGPVERQMTSMMQRSDGSWAEFMTARYRRRT